MFLFFCSVKCVFIFCCIECVLAFLFDKMCFGFFCLIKCVFVFPNCPVVNASRQCTTNLSYPRLKTGSHTGGECLKAMYNQSVVSQTKGWLPYINTRRRSACCYFPIRTSLVAHSSWCYRSFFFYSLRSLRCYRWPLSLIAAQSHLSSIAFFDSVSTFYFLF